MHHSLRDRTNRADDGMSIVEVLIASVILLVALTAMLGLLMTSTGLSAKARAESLAVKTASAFLEKVRALPYANLTQTRLNSMASAASGTLGGMTVSVSATMTPQWEPSQSPSDPPAYQHILVTARVAGPGFKTFSFATGTYVREWKWTQRTAALPIVDFDALTPPAGATARPVYGTIHVGATAESTLEDVLLTQLYVKIGTTQLTSSTPNAMTGSCSTNWDTTTYADGEYTLFAEVWDALNGKDSKSRTFVVDNVLPPAPSAAVLASTTGNSAVTWKWSQVKDGISPVPGYLVDFQNQGSSGAWTSVASGNMARPSDESSVTTARATAAFSRYRTVVTAIGAREWAGITTPWHSAATVGQSVITRPSFSAMTVTVRQQNSQKPFYFTASSLAVTPPTFPVTSPSYRWEYKIGTGSWTPFASAAAPNTNPSTVTTVAFPEVTGPSSSAQASLSFRCTATVTIDGVVTVLKSPIMTKTYPSGGASYTLTSFDPDWTAW